MAVMTAQQKAREQETVAKKHGKFRDKTRPITATLEHPLILDIKLLKKLDMTTFTKKGLIALSKFCGISLINKTDSKRKLNKCVKTIQYLKKQTGAENKGVLPKCPSIESNNRDNSKGQKRKPGKKVAKAKPRIRFKIGEEGNSQEEDSSDVVCKRHEKGSKESKVLVKHGAIQRKAMVDDILSNSIENLIPEPCKTCSRSEHPERFHSHPKMSLKLSGQSVERNLEERFKNVVTTKDSEGGGKRKSAKDTEGQLPRERGKEQSTPVSPRKPNSKSPEAGNKSKGKNLRKPLTPSSTETKSSNETAYLKKPNSKNEKDGAPTSPVEEAMKFVTGCYVCGRQVSPKSRIKHEESCITEWRTHNSLLSPNERKPEPKRPDFRFTALGDLDCQGTFDSIWANHKDSLVPCKKCGRRFFPDRIERHENCCNNIPITVKYKH